MKILKLKTTNFCNLKGEYEFTIPHICALIGANGIGKSTILNAIRYVLTGAKPEYDVINKECDEMSVAITIDGPEEEFTFKRYEHREKPSKFYINKTATTQKNLNQMIETVTGIPVEKIKITSSSDIVAAMKPQEFSSFILDYIPKKLPFSDVVGFIPEMTMGMAEVCEALLPEEDIDLDILSEVEGMLRGTRKDIKDTLKMKEVAYSSMPNIAPSETREEVEKEIKELLTKEAQRKVYLAELASYNNALVSKEKHEKFLLQLKEEADKIAATKPDGSIKELELAVVAENDSLRNIDNGLNSMSMALRQLEQTLSALEKPICPISPLITCHENKTVAIEEVSETITSTKESMVSLNEEREKIVNRISELQKKISEYRENSNKYDKRISLLKQIEVAKKSAPKVPEKPETIPEIDVKERKEQLNDMLTYINKYEEGISLSKQIEELKIQVEDYEKLCKAFADKGPVKTGVVAMFLSVFEEICNDFSKKIRPEINFSFKSENGVTVYMDAGNGVELPYEAHSSGEKAYMLFVIMNMVNKLTGVNILLLDELSVIDNNCFRKLMDTVLASESEYDHIILAAVDHVDTVEAVKEKEIPIFNIGDFKIS